MNLIKELLVFIWKCFIDKTGTTHKNLEEISKLEFDKVDTLYTTTFETIYTNYK